jgi:hypothetical protein
MTDRQAAWASAHDWYRWSECIGPGQFKVHVRPSFEGDTQTEFTDYQELRAWAGY